jgi:hypothetical protein
MPYLRMLFDIRLTQIDQKMILRTAIDKKLPDHHGMPPQRTVISWNHSARSTANCQPFGAG